MESRTLHLLDVEYLGGGPTFSAADLDLVLDSYRPKVGCSPRDHLVGAASNWVYKRIAFNNLLAEQQDSKRGGGGDARLTLVQFDSQDPHEVLVDGARITEVRPLSDRTFVPRGGTPLLDATGRVITMASVREQQRATLGKRPEVITIITITDGHENQSREFSIRDIRRLVKEKEAHGWSFAYMGANPDAYGEAGGIGYDPRSTMAFAPDGAGAGEAFANLSRAMTNKRGKLRRGESWDVADFYEGDKAAEADRRRRHGS